MIFKAKIVQSFRLPILLFGFITCMVYNQPVAAKQKELVIVAWEIPYGLDPTHEYTPGYLHSVGALEYLMRLTSDAKIEPELAQSLQALDKNTWELKLRPNVTFWSGEKVDAGAIKASLERSKKLAPQAGPLLKGIEIKIIDPKTIHLVTKKPHPTLPLNLTNQWLGIHNAESYGPDKNPFNLAVMDLTGYFKVVDFKPKQMITLERWNGYSRRKPIIDRIVYKQISEPQARVMAMLTGEVHIARNVSASSAMLLKANNDVELVEIPRPSIGSVYLNLEAPVMKDVRVRQALAWSIDRQEVIRLARGGYGKPAYSYYATNPAYPEAGNVGYLKLNTKKADQLLDQAGWKRSSNNTRQKNGKSFKIRLLSYGGNKPASELLQHYWGKIGIDVEVQHSPDYGIAQSKRSEGAWEAVIEGWGNFPTHQQMWRHFAPEGDINYGPVNDPKINTIMDELALTIDQKRHNELVYQANQWIVDTVPIIPLYSNVALKAKHKAVKGFIPHFFHWQYEVDQNTSLSP